MAELAEMQASCTGQGTETAEDVTQAGGERAARRLEPHRRMYQ